ncbi:hypothetical protein L2E82_38684 [Cichorium intybus]|uniref:Uncharacterized protein n=1 Tax=Cichorium intybus TaxID=13427 RepID=A0ACB9AGZ0_CICIN|nr:hypothetical protein L2E82_38684 [Cichorium intybus]
MPWENEDQLDLQFGQLAVEILQKGFMLYASKIVAYYTRSYVQIGIKAEWRNHQGPLLANVLGRYQWLTFLIRDLSTSWLECDPGPIFTPETFELPDGVRGEFFWITNIALVPSSLKSAPNENMQYDIRKKRW